MKKTFTITPFTSVGNIYFGANRDDVRNILGQFTEFRKTRFSKNTTDDFGGLHVYYSEEDTVDAIEFFPQDTMVLYKERDLFDLSEEDLIMLFSDPSFKEEPGHLTFANYGVEIGMEDDVITSILVHKKGY